MPSDCVYSKGDGGNGESQLKPAEQLTVTG